MFNCPCGTTVTVKVCADEGDAVDESDETNNCLENAFNCPPCPGEPDLIITAKSETLTDSMLEVTYTVANNGGVDAGASTTCIYVDGTEVATDPVGALAAGATHEGTVVIDPFNCPCGTTITIKVCADKDGTVDEGDETNNCRENTFSCSSCPGEQQLCASLGHNFGTVQEGQTRTWPFEITNCGGGTLDWTVSDDHSWITVSPTGGTGTGTVTVRISTAGLSPGTHTGTVTVDSNGGQKTGTISVNVQTLPPAEVPTFTPIGMFALVGLLGVAGISVIKRR
jgi:subtilase family serine protease